MKLRERHFLAIIQTLVIVCLISLCAAASLAQEQTKPLTLITLMRAIETGKNITDRSPVKAFVAQLDKRGVDFQLTEGDEKRIRVAGSYYGTAGLDAIIAAVRKNFRPGPAASSPLQVQYRLVAGNSIDFFLRKSSNKDWQMLDIEGRVSIVPNNTYTALSKLARTFSVPFERQYFDFRNAERTSEEVESSSSRDTEMATSYQDQKRSIFVGSGGQDEFPTIHLNVPDLVGSLQKPDKPWRIYLREKPGDNFGSPLLRTQDIEGVYEFCLVLTNSERQPEGYRDDQLLQRVSVYIRNQLSSSTKEFLNTCSAPRPSRRGSADRLNAQIKPLVDDLNKILRGPSLYHQEAFKAALNRSPVPSPIAIPLPAPIPTGEDLVRLNRAFLVNIYQDFIHKEAESSFVFLKQLEKEDFAQLDVLGRFYAHISQRGLPASFGFIETTTSFEGFGEGCSLGIQPVDSSRVVAPYLAMWIAVFENVTASPLRLGDFALRENVSDSLRTREEDTNTLNAQGVRQVPLYPIGILRPSEKLIVPLELVLMYPEDIKQLPGFDPSQLGKGELDKPFIKSTQLTTVEEELPFRRTSEIRLPSGKINTTKILDILRRPPVTFTTQQKYVYGPSMKIDNVEVNEASYQVRSFNPDKPMITSSGYMGASCPFVHTYDRTKKQWVNEGVVMAGFDNKTKEALDVKLLHRFDGRIMLEEKEAEDSFIDFLQVRVKTIDGKEILLHAKNKLLLTIDGGYIKLRQGQRLVVDFDIPNGLQALEYTLEVSGYYVPYEYGVRKRIQ